MVLKDVSQCHVVQGDGYSRKGITMHWCRIGLGFAVLMGSCDRKRNRGEGPSFCLGGSRGGLIRKQMPIR